MYRFTTRPQPLDLLLPSPHYSTFDIDRRKDLGLPLPHTFPAQRNQTHLESAKTGGLHTPPEELEMASTYQPPQQYNAGRDYYSEGYGQSRSWSNQPSATTLRREVQGPYSATTQPSSPQLGNRVENQDHMDNSTRRKSTTSDSIRSNLQIPDDISVTGGSLPDFAAQVR